VSKELGLEPCKLNGSDSMGVVPVRKVYVTDITRLPLPIYPKWLLAKLALLFGASSSGSSGSTK